MLEGSSGVGRGVSTALLATASTFWQEVSSLPRPPWLGLPRPPWPGLPRPPGLPLHMLHCSSWCLVVKETTGDRIMPLARTLNSMLLTCIFFQISKNINCFFSGSNAVCDTALGRDPSRSSLVTSLMWGTKQGEKVSEALLSGPTASRNAEGSVILHVQNVVGACPIHSGLLRRDWHRRGPRGTGDRSCV